MEKCFRCEGGEKEVKLLDAIYENEIVKICERCGVTESIPIIRKPTTSQLKESERSYGAYQRLKTLSGGKEGERIKESILDKMKKLDENPDLEKPEKEKPFNLIDNFHWEITRGRRNKGLSQRQLAWAIGESETAIKMLEKGELPEQPEKLIRKLEQFFQVKLRERTESELMEERRRKDEKEGFKIKSLEEEPEFDEIPVKPVLEEEEEDIEEFPEPREEMKLEDVELEEKPSPTQILKFEPELMGNVTISDLQQIKEEKEKEDRLLESEEERKKSLQANSLIKGLSSEDKRRLEFKEKVGEEMKEIALGRNIETMNEKREILNKGISKINKEEEEEKEKKVPTIHELMEKKRDKARNDERRKRKGEEEIRSKVEKEIPKSSLREKSAEEIIIEAEEKQEEDAIIGEMVGNEIELEDE